MTQSASSTEQRQRAQRGTGLAMLGSAAALIVAAALTWTGVLPLDDAIRGWAAGGIGMAGVVDALLGTYFLRASSQP